MTSVGKGLCARIVREKCFLTVTLSLNLCVAAVGCSG